jgi:hypothetical protein
MRYSEYLQILAPWICTDRTKTYQYNFKNLGQDPPIAKIKKKEEREKSLLAF